MTFSRGFSKYFPSGRSTSQVTETTAKSPWPRLSLSPPRRDEQSECVLLAAHSLPRLFCDYLPGGGQVGK
jgi:hypothetical protein